MWKSHVALVARLMYQYPSLRKREGNSEEEKKKKRGGIRPGPRQYLP